MRREIIFAPEAVRDFKALKAKNRSAVRDGIETHLRYEPTKTSKSRIKRLRGLRQPQYRLRIEGIRVFFDVKYENVEVLAIVEKSRAAAWLEKHGNVADIPNEEGERES